MQLVPKELRKLRCAEASQAELGACFSRIIACIMLASSGPLKRGILCMFVGEGEGAGGVGGIPCTCVGEGERGGGACFSPVSDIEARNPVTLRGGGGGIVYLLIKRTSSYSSGVRAVTYRAYEH